MIKYVMRIYEMYCLNSGYRISYIDDDDFSDNISLPDLNSKDEELYDESMEIEYDRKSYIPAKKEMNKFLNDDKKSIIDKNSIIKRKSQIYF